MKLRSYKKKDRKDMADINKIHWDSLSPEQKIAQLDDRLGEGVGAISQRARLQLELKGG